MELEPHELRDLKEFINSTAWSVVKTNIEIIIKDKTETLISNDESRSDLRDLNIIRGMAQAKDDIIRLIEEGF